MKLIPNYPSYTITREGEVRNVKKDRVLKTYVGNNGYNITQLYGNKKRHSFTIARLLALTYIPNPDNKATIDHINRDRQDDRLENLRWASAMEQCHNKGRTRRNTSGITNIGKYKNHWIYSKTIDGLIYRKSHLSKQETCFEQYIHSRVLRCLAIA